MYLITTTYTARIPLKRFTPTRTRTAPSYPKASFQMIQMHKWIPWPIRLAFNRPTVIYIVYVLFFVSAFNDQVCPKCSAMWTRFFFSFRSNCTIPPTCCISAWPTLKDDFLSDWVHSKKWQPTLPALSRRQCVHLVIGENRASFVSSPVNTQKHDTFRSNYTMSSVYSPGMACTIGTIRLVPVLRGISAGSRCHCRTNGVISTAIRLILFKLKKMISLMLDRLLLDNLQLGVGFIYPHYLFI